MNLNVSPRVRSTFPTAAAALLYLGGGIALLLGVLLLLFPLGARLGYPLPGLYRYILVSLALIGATLHLLAGRWAHQRRHFFRVITATLFGMVFLQFTFPLDLLAILLLALARGEFDTTTS